MSGLGDALQQIGTGMMNRGFAQKDERKAEQMRQKQAAEDQALWEKRQAYLARLQAPPERVRQVYDDQLGKAMNVREQWQPGDGQAPGQWVESGRDLVPPKDAAPQIVKMRQGDDEVTSIIDPNDPDSAREIGRGSAFNPKQRAAAASQTTSGAGATSARGGSLNTKGAPSGYAWSDDGLSFEKIPGGPADKKDGGDDIKLTSSDRKNVATTRQKLGTLDAIENQLNNVEALFEPLKGSWSAGGGGQGALPTENGKKFDAAVAQLSPLMRQLTRVPGEGAVSDYETKLLENASLNRGDYESTTAEKLKNARQLLGEMRKAHSMSLDTYGLDENGQPKGSKQEGAAEEAPKPRSASAANAAGASRDNPVRITSEDQADSLPPGTWVMLNGRLGQT